MQVKRNKPYFSTRHTNLQPPDADTLLRVAKATADWEQTFTEPKKQEETIVSSTVATSTSNLITFHMAIIFPNLLINVYLRLSTLEALKHQYNFSFRQEVLVKLLVVK